MVKIVNLLNSTYRNTGLGGVLSLQQSIQYSAYALQNLSRFFPKYRYTCTLSIQRLFIIPLKCFTTYMYFLQNILNLSSSAREGNI